MYDLPQDILSTLIRKDIAGPDNTGDENTRSSPTDQAAVVAPQPESAIGSKSCSLCGVAFQTVEDQRSHVRSDLHTYNLKQKVRGAKPVTEGDFEKLVGGRQALE